MGRLIWKIALHRICGNNRGRRSYRPGRRVWSAERRTVGAFGSGRHWSCRRRIRLDRPGPRSGMACPRKTGIAYPCGRPAGPVLGRSAGNRSRIPYRDAGRNSSRILRRRRRSLGPCQFGCRPLRPAVVLRCGMPRRTRCARNTSGRRMGARPILHMRSRVTVCLATPGNSWTAGSTRRLFRGRSRAGRIAGPLGRSGVFAILCRDNAR
jgi:hypothetical protein